MTANAHAAAARGLLRLSDNRLADVQSMASRHNRDTSIREEVFVMTPETMQQEKSKQQSSSTGVTQNEQNATQDHERPIASNRETTRQGHGSTGVATRPRTTPAYGRGDIMSPFTLMQRMTEDMDRLFEQFGFGRMGLSPTVGAALDRDLWRGPGIGGIPTPALWAPQVEVRQHGDKVVVRADLPGVKKEDLHVEIDNDVLTLSGERRAEHEEKGDGFYRSERSYGEFYRAIALPEGANPDQCEASFKDGVLEVTLPAPKAQQRTAKRIAIR
jgi:HSP20 family protein